MPEDPARFIESYSECLGLSDSEVAELLGAFAYDILSKELGECLARELVSMGALHEQPMRASLCGSFSQLHAYYRSELARL